MRPEKDCNKADGRERSDDCPFWAKRIASTSAAIAGDYAPQRGRPVVPGASVPFAAGDSAGGLLPDIARLSRGKRRDSRMRNDALRRNGTAQFWAQLPNGGILWVCGDCGAEMEETNDAGTMETERQLRMTIARKSKGIEARLSTHKRANCWRAGTDGMRRACTCVETVHASWMRRHDEANRDA